jgi:hypothetical protein
MEQEMQEATQIEIVDLDEFEEEVINCACKAGDDLPYK